MMPGRDCRGTRELKVERSVGAMFGLGGAQWT
jgi:hypothetical protein